MNLPGRFGYESWDELGADVIEGIFAAFDNLGVMLVIVLLGGSLILLLFDVLSESLGGPGIF